MYLKRVDVYFTAFLLCVVQICSGDNELMVQTPYGTYKGQLIKSRGGRDIISFKGVPYAQPPVGALRFKEPVQLEKQEGIFDANKDRECIQATFAFANANISEVKNSKYIGSEDCLYLNIYRPKEITKGKLIPVFFWIHGGAFSFHSGAEAWHGPRLFLDEDRDMIFVTTNYRLGMLGFLSANDETIPGNVGLKDQTMALKWVKENIELFGGDPNSITIGGQSAGGASVSLHMRSKASRGLFHRAISMSGSGDCLWAIKPTKEARKIASKLITYLGCPSEPNELLQCLQGLSVEKIIDAQLSLKVKGTTQLTMYLAPVIEKDSPNAFMTDDSVALKSDMPWLAGVTSEEGLLFYVALLMDDQGYKNMSTFRNHYKKFLPILGYYECNAHADIMTEKLKDFYFGDDYIGEESKTKLIKLLSDRILNHCVVVSARKHPGNTYLYKLSHRGRLSVVMDPPEALKNGVSHGDDSMYFFDFTIGINIPLRGKDLELSKMMLKMWYNFIKEGDPTPDSHLWEESDGGKKFLDFTSDGPVMSSNMFKERFEFLDQFTKQYEIHDEL